MKIFDAKGNKLTLTDQDFLAEGGEGKLYARKSMVYKIWHDANHLVPVAKLLELEQLDHSQIIRPKGALYDSQGKPVGYEMSRVPQNAVALARLITTSYWNANHIDMAMMMQLVQRMYQVIAYIHSKGFLQVDGNEFNYMVSDNYQQPWFVDVDSYQTPSYPATGIMLSVRDYTRDDFDEGTDWYSFAVVAFQLLCGIHPYRGRHPDYKKGELELRVKNGVSVLRPSVSTPPSVRDFTLIPARWLDWFKLVFNQGQRLPPPDGKVRVDVARKLTLIEDGKKIEIKRLAEYPSAVTEFYNYNGVWVVRAGDTLYIGKQAYAWPATAQGAVLDNAGRAWFISTKNNQLEILDEHGKANASSVQAQTVFVFNNVAYAMNEDDLMELMIHEIAGQKRLSVTSVRKILPHATQVYKGMLIQNVLGRIHLMLPEGGGVMAILAVPELDQYRIIDAKYESKVAVLRVADKNGYYQQVRIMFNNRLDAYSIEELGDEEEFGDAFNFTVIRKQANRNILVSLPEQKRIEIMHVKRQAAGFDKELRVVEDDKIQTVMRLANDAERVAFYSGKSLYSMNMK